MREFIGERGVSAWAAGSRMGRPRPSRGVAGESPISSPDSRSRLLPVLLLRLMLLLRRTGLLAVPRLLRSAAMTAAGSARRDVLLSVRAPLRGVDGVSVCAACKLICCARGLLAAGVVIPCGTNVSASEVARSSDNIVWQPCW